MSRLLTLFGGDSGGWALKAIADLGYSVANPAAFGAWADAARAKTNSSTLMVFTNPSSTLLFEILLRAQTTGDKISVYWDDGASNDYTLNDMAGADTTVGHTYASAANRTVVVCGAEHVRRLYSAQTDGRTAFGGNISSWTWLTYLYATGSNTLSGSVAALTGLTFLYVTGSNTLSGSVAALTGLTYLAVYGSNTLSGSVAALTALTYLAVYGSNTLSGSVAALTELPHLSVGGNNTLSGSVAALTGLTFLYVTGSNTLSGSVAALTGLTVLAVQGSNTLSGSVAALTGLTFLYVTGSNTLSGSVAALTALTYLAVYGSNTLSGSVAALTELPHLSVGGNNTLSGSVAALTGLTFLAVYGSNTITGFDGVAASATKLAYFKMNNALSEAVVNGILAGFWANRDVAKTRTERVIDLNDNAGSAAPTGQGITDRDALRLYISPPGEVAWTVETN